jgi:pimeloyl-ACP methyl ester carboxylesterase
VTAEGSGAFREEHVALATGRLHLLRHGEGPPLVFLHHSIGSPGWLPVHSALAERFDVLVVDMPGYAGSERPAWAREPRDLAIILGQMIAPDGPPDGLVDLNEPIGGREKAACTSYTPRRG